MKSRTNILIIALVVIGGLFFGANLAQAIPFFAPEVSSSTPHMVSYQGRVSEGGVPFDGTGYFRFAIVDAAESTYYWTNDGATPPVASVSLVVDDGYFEVNLGDTLVPNMNPIGVPAFQEAETYLKVWFSSDDATFTALPKTRITAVPYALVAESLDGFDVSDFSPVSHLHDNRYYQQFNNVIIVAKRGGHYESVVDAIKSITDAAADNPYLIWVAPGEYIEKAPILFVPYVHIQGAGQEVTIILSGETADTNPPNNGALILAPHTSLRDLTLKNLGKGPYNTGILAKTGVTDTLISDVTISAEGTGDHNYAMYFYGDDLLVQLENVNATGKNGSLSNRAMMLYLEAEAIVHGGTFHAFDQISSVFSLGSRAVLSATHTTGYAEGTSVSGVDAGSGSQVYLAGGNFTLLGDRSGYQYGLKADGTDTVLTANNVSIEVSGEDSDIALVNVYGLRNTGGAASYLDTVDIAATGDEYVFGVLNEDSASFVRANDVRVTAVGEENVFGFDNFSSAVLFGGEYFAEGADSVVGIRNSLGTLRANDTQGRGKFGGTVAGGLQVTGGHVFLVGGEYIGQTGSAATFGLANDGWLQTNDVTATSLYPVGPGYGLLNTSYAFLYGGSFTAENGFSGTDAHGILNQGGELVAEQISAIGRNGSDENYGLLNTLLGIVEVKGGAFTAQDGTYATGIANEISGTILTASDFSVLAENASSRNVGLYNFDAGWVMISQASLIASGGGYAIGIENTDLHSTLIASNIFVNAENGTTGVYGLANSYAAVTEVEHGTFIANGEGTVFGIRNYRGTIEGGHITSRGFSTGGAGVGLGNADKGNPTLIDFTYCLLEGNTYSFETDTPTVVLSHCHLVVAPDAPGGTSSCVASTQGYSLLDSTCTPIP